ncbi:copper amine oxidase N-terminal domain-containing protein [Pseudobacteroides cellulosolvens]|uniref:Copper amine oxidase-like domain-containing protein n=1 Tax=Pseudobacteroides cellulosolvens ATCC 35603 = DSM 2933 TaxID=398512 RepID=A0A0L6JLC7_9FIRM|nr:copper amine oxidase N-terminal domain-containing protein [Pseudobacteroides cellulosolvens]KNY26548.1 copper amine oxidase-like domain-containing protein [Pseudobacteroides cellulosolvens ATCC 35603 = DSM 2933]
MKIKNFIVLVVMFVFIGVFAANSLADSSMVEISFKVGDSVLNINGNDVKVQTPYVENGATLVPVAVISQAFGADVKWNASERSVNISYGDTKIKLVINNKTAYVNGTPSVLLKAPAIKNNVTMVPLTFISENFGADVTYDKKTKQINVSKVIAGDKSIKDFSLILKKTTKSKIGDSYYKWSMNLPKELRISDRSFDGTFTTFNSLDDSYAITVGIFDKEDDTLDTLMASVREDLGEDYTLVSQGKKVKNGQEYSKTVYKGDGVIDVRYYIKGDRVFKITLYMEEYDKYIGSSVYTDIVDSFATDYVQNSSIEDLSDISKEGFRKYEDKKLKFSMNVYPEWFKADNENTPNVVEFYSKPGSIEDYYDSLHIDMYSAESGFTADDWAKKLIKDMEDDINPDFYKVLKQEDGEINGVKCEKVYYTQKVAGMDIYSCDVFIVGKKYKYNVYYHIKSETYNDKKKLSEIENALNSFKFTEPDTAKIGELMDPNYAEDKDSTVMRQSTKNKWAVNLPVSWIADSESNNDEEILYGSGMKAFGMAVRDGVSMEAYISDSDEEIAKRLKLGSLKDSKKEVLKEKGTDVYKYVSTQVYGKENIHVENYVVSKNDHLYIITLSIPEANLSEKNKKLFSDIWQSMKFE